MLSQPQTRPPVQRTLGLTAPANANYTAVGNGIFGAGTYNFYVTGIGSDFGSGSVSGVSVTPETFGPALGNKWEIGQVRVRALMPSGGANTHDLYIGVFRNKIPALGSPAQQLQSSYDFVSLDDSILSMAEYPAATNMPQLADFINNPIVNSGEFICPCGMSFSSAGEVGPANVYWQISITESEA